MTTFLSPDLHTRVREKMLRAGYASPEDVLREALDALDAKEQLPSPPVGKEQLPAESPIWEQFEQAGRALPEQVVAALPPDGASEHDHYIYGTPKQGR